MLLGNRSRLLPLARLQTRLRVSREVPPDSEEPDARRLSIRDPVSEPAQPIHKVERSPGEDEADGEVPDGHRQRQEVDWI